LKSFPAEKIFDLSTEGCNESVFPISIPPSSLSTRAREPIICKKLVRGGKIAVFPKIGLLFPVFSLLKNDNPGKE
jgi:hypothetical protein